MKRILWLALVALALPIAASADSVTFTSEGSAAGAKLTFNTTTGFSLSSAPTSFVSFDGVTICSGIGACAGTESFNTGAITGTLGGGGSFGPGGSFDATGGGYSFSGTFTGGTWAKVGGKTWQLTGALTGSLCPPTGPCETVNGGTVEITFLNSNGTLSPVSGDTGLSTPEPGSLSLLGTGLIGLAGLVRRKIKA